MGDALEGSASQDADLRARLDQLEDMVRGLMARSDIGAVHFMPAPLGQGHGADAQRFLLSGSGISSRPAREDRARHNEPMSFTRGRAKLVRGLIRERRRREHHFPADLFADPAWDMMLDLYASHYEGREIGVSSLCIAAAVPATTALRWIKLMVDDGHFIRFNDPHDGRRILVSLSDDARCRLDDYFDNLND